MPEIQAIYAHHVLNGTGTFDEEPPSVEEMLERFRKVRARGWAVAGRGRCHRRARLRLLHPVPRPRRLPLHCVEDSVYVREDVRGQGVGKALVAQLLEDATARGMRQMIAVIGDSENVGLDRRACQPRVSRWSARCVRPG